MARCERQKGYGNTAKKVPELEDPLFAYGRRNIYIYIYIYIHTHTHTHTHTIAHGMWTTQQYSSRIGDRGFQELPRTLKKEDAKSACTHITLQSNTFSLY